jgi:hypothetical protein
MPLRPLILTLALLSLLFNSAAWAGKILFIGDSHSVGEFGVTLDGLLRQDPKNQVSSLAFCGASSESWLYGPKTKCGYRIAPPSGNPVEKKSGQGPKLSELLSKFDPDQVIIELGNNDIGSSLSDAQIVAHIDRITSTVVTALGPGRCFWISGPETRLLRSQGTREISLIEKGVARRCKVFNSYSVTHYPDGPGDGIHYNTPELKPLARQWALDAFDALISP